MNMQLLANVKNWIKDRKVPTNTAYEGYKYLKSEGAIRVHPVELRRIDDRDYTLDPQVEEINKLASTRKHLLSLEGYILTRPIATLIGSVGAPLFVKVPQVYNQPLYYTLNVIDADEQWPEGSLVLVGRCINNNTTFNLVLLPDEEASVLLEESPQAVQAITFLLTQWGYCYTGQPKVGETETTGVPYLRVVPGQQDLHHKGFNLGHNEIVWIDPENGLSFTDEGIQYTKIALPELVRIDYPQYITDKFKNLRGIPKGQLQTLMASDGSGKSNIPVEIEGKNIVVTG